MNKFIQPLAGCLILAATVFGSATAMILVAFSETTWAAITAAVAIAIITAAAVAIRQFHRQPNVAPDFLAELSKAPYADAQGFCFRVSLVAINRQLSLQIHFQNRFDRPCRGTLRLAPRGFFTAVTEPLSLPINCSAGEYGVANLPWSLPQKFAGKWLNFHITADVHYPNGKGNQLRFRQANDIRGGRAFSRVRIPHDFDETAPGSNFTVATVWSMGDSQALGFPVEPAASEKAKPLNENANG